MRWIPRIGARRASAADLPGDLLKRVMSLVLGAALVIVSSIVGFVDVLSAAGVSPWLNTTGPGGGTVYYYNSGGFSCGVDLTSTCHFLEVAGSDWDAKNRKWSSNFHSVSGTSKNLGSGAKNTSLIVAGNSTLEYAATDAAAFVSNTGLGDWFLPSLDELMLMDGDQYSTNFGEPGTSSQVGSTTWWTYDSLKNRTLNNSPKNEAFKVLAVRAFSKSDSSLSGVSVAGEVLTPNFDPSVTSYSVTTSESSAQLTAVAVGASSVVIGTSSGSSSVGNGTQSAPISLEAGLNQVTLTVTAADSTSTSYTLNINRQMPGYAVSFDGNGATGGSVPSAQTKTHGVDLTVASNSGNLVREGYAFAGWNTAADSSGTAYAEGATYTTDAVLTLYAVWTGNPLTVTYDTQDGSVVADGSTASGGVVAEAPESPTRAGHTFTGWFASSSGGSAITFPYTHGQTADFTLYAQWDIDTYAVTFDGNGATGGSVPADQSKTYGVDLTVASNSGSLVRTGFTFSGWNSQADGDGTAYAEGATYSANAPLSLYAVWAGNPLTVTYATQDGSAVADGSSVSGGSIAVLPDAPTRAGFTFTGWFVSSTGGTAISAPHTHGQTADFTLYAQWVQSSLYGLGSVTKIGTITTVTGIGNTFAADTPSSSVSLRYPADALPDNTVIDVYLVNDMSRAESLVPAGGGYVVSLVVAWLAADGTVPTTAIGKPLSMTITNDTIVSGAKTYAIVGGQVVLLGTATTNGSVTISITDDPEIVVVNPSATPPTTTSPPSSGGGGGSGGQVPPSTQPPSTLPPSTLPPSSSQPPTTPETPERPSFVDSDSAAELVRGPGRGGSLVDGESRSVDVGSVSSPATQVAQADRTPEQIAEIREAARAFVEGFLNKFPESSRTSIAVVSSEFGASIRGLVTDAFGRSVDVPAENIMVVGSGSVAMMVGATNTSFTDQGALSIPDDSLFGLAGGGLGSNQRGQVVVMSTPTLVAEFISNADGTFTISGSFLSSLGAGNHTLVLATEDLQLSLGIEVTESTPMFELPVTGSGQSTTDLLVTVALFLLVFGVLGRRAASGRSRIVTAPRP